MEFSCTCILYEDSVLHIDTAETLCASPNMCATVQSAHLCNQNNVKNVNIKITIHIFQINTVTRHEISCVREFNQHKFMPASTNRLFTHRKRNKIRFHRKYTSVKKSQYIIKLGHKKGTSTE